MPIIIIVVCTSLSLENSSRAIGSDQEFILNGEVRRLACGVHVGLYYLRYLRLYCIWYIVFRSGQASSV